MTLIELQFAYMTLNSKLFVHKEVINYTRLQKLCTKNAYSINDKTKQLSEKFSHRDIISNSLVSLSL